jgi:hypothetical protein
VGKNAQDHLWNVKKGSGHRSARGRRRRKTRRRRRRKRRRRREGEGEKGKEKRTKEKHTNPNGGIFHKYMDSALPRGQGHETKNGWLKRPDNSVPCESWIGSQNRKGLLIENLKKPEQSLSSWTASYPC